MIYAIVTLFVTCVVVLSPQSPMGGNACMSVSFSTISRSLRFTLCASKPLSLARSARLAYVQ